MRALTTVHEQLARIADDPARVKKCLAGRGCWIWLGTKSDNGYAQFMYRDRRYYGHRVAYELTNGAIPDGLQIDHLCSNRACVNPDHLEAVTSAENTRRGIRTKLTQDLADEIRASTEHPNVLADRYGVSPATIYNIRAGRRWVTDGALRAA